MRFKNSTENAYQSAVYQEYPDSPGLDSVAWQVQGLGPGATNRVDWSLNYQVAIPTGTKTAISTLEVRRSLLNWVSPMRSSQKRRTFLSSIQPQQGPLEKNRFTTPFPPKGDHAIDHKLIAAEKDVDAEEIVEFSVHPQYNIAC